MCLHSCCGPHVAYPAALAALSFNVHFFRLLKWLLVVPFALMSGALLLSDDLTGKALPLAF